MTVDGQFASDRRFVGLLRFPKITVEDHRQDRTGDR
jgi:hypothetical protein